MKTEWGLKPLSIPSLECFATLALGELEKLKSYS